MKKEKIIIIPEKSLGDLIKQSFDLLKSNKPINFDNGELDNSPKMDGDEIHYGKDGKPLSHHRCNICNYLFNNSELLEDKDIGLICEDCNDNKKELEQEQKDVATLIQDERNDMEEI